MRAKLLTKVLKLKRNNVQTYKSKVSITSFLVRIYLLEKVYD